MESGLKGLQELVSVLNPTNTTLQSPINTIDIRVVDLVNADGVRRRENGLSSMIGGTGIEMEHLL